MPRLKRDLNTVEGDPQCLLVGERKLWREGVGAEKAIGGGATAFSASIGHRTREDPSRHPRQGIPALALAALVYLLLDLSAQVSLGAGVTGASVREVLLHLAHRS